MPTLSFEHPELGAGPVLDHGATEITWSYNMNAVTFPTYGGEVIQILSVNIGDLSMTGQFTSYKEMEDFYKWFINYMQVASQGRGGHQRPGISSYNQHPITFHYPHRGWQIEIMPTQLPGFQQGRDVVVPTWRLQAFVMDAQDDVARIEDLIRDNIDLEGLAKEEASFNLTGKIGFIENNPWSNPFPDDEKTFDPDRTKEVWGDIGDYYNKLIPSYLAGDFDTLTSGLYSKPAFYSIGATTTDDSTKTAKGKVQKIRAGK